MPCAVGVSVTTPNVRLCDRRERQMVDALRVKLAGEHGDIAAEAVHTALGAALSLAAEASSALDLSGGTWTVQELALGSATLAIANPAAPGAVALITTGFEALAWAPRVPDRWNLKMVRQAQALARLVGRRGVTGVEVGAGGSPGKDVDGVLGAHAESALAMKESALGSLVGTVDMWQARKGATVGLTLDSGETIRATYLSELAHRIVSDAVDHRIVISGEIKRNGAGQRVGIVIHDFELAPRVIPMDVRQLAGLYADLGSAGLSVAEVLEHRE